MGSRNHKKTSILDYRDQGFKIKNTTDKISDLRKYYNYFMDQVRNYDLSNFVEGVIILHILKVSKWKLKSNA